MVGGQHLLQMGPACRGDGVVLPQPPVGGGLFFALLQVSGGGDPVNGGIGKDDTQGTVAAGLQQGGEFPDVVLPLSEEEEDEQLCEGFFKFSSRPLVGRDLGSVSFGFKNITYFILS